MIEAICPKLLYARCPLTRQTISMGPLNGNPDGAAPAGIGTLNLISMTWRKLASPNAVPAEYTPASRNSAESRFIKVLSRLAAEADEKHADQHERQAGHLLTSELLLKEQAPPEESPDVT